MMSTPARPPALPGSLMIVTATARVTIGLAGGPVKAVRWSGDTLVTALAGPAAS
jgi:hypothetical protein